MITNFVNATEGVERKTSFAMELVRNISKFENDTVRETFSKAMSKSLRQMADATLSVYKKKFLPLESQEIDTVYMTSEVNMLDIMEKMEEIDLSEEPKKRRDAFYEFLKALIETKPMSEFIPKGNFYTDYMAKKTALILSYVYPEATFDERILAKTVGRWLKSHYGLDEETYDSLVDAFFEGGRGAVYELLKEKGVMNPTNASEMRSTLGLWINSYGNILKEVKEMVHKSFSRYVKNSDIEDIITALENASENAMSKERFGEFKSILRKTITYMEKGIVPIFTAKEKEFISNDENLAEAFARKFSSEPEFSMVEENGNERIEEIRDADGNVVFLHIETSLDESLKVDLSRYENLRGVKICEPKADVDDKGFLIPHEAKTARTILLDKKRRERPIHVKMERKVEVEYEGLPENVASIHVDNDNRYTPVKLVSNFPSYKIAEKISGAIETLELQVNEKKLKDEDFVKAARYFFTGEDAVENFNILTAHNVKFGGSGFGEILENTLSGYAKLYDVLAEDVSAYDEDSLERHLTEQTISFNPENVVPASIVNVGERGKTFKNYKTDHAVYNYLLSGKKEIGSEIDEKMVGGELGFPAHFIETNLPEEATKEEIKRFISKTTRFSHERNIRIWPGMSKFALGVAEYYGKQKQFSMSNETLFQMVKEVLEKIGLAMSKTSIVPLHYVTMENGTVNVILDEIKEMAEKNIDPNKDNHHWKKMVETITAVQRYMDDIGGNEELSFEEAPKDVAKIMESLAKSKDEATTSFFNMILEENEKERNKGVDME